MLSYVPFIEFAIHMPQSIPMYLYFTLSMTMTNSNMITYAYVAWVIPQNLSEICSFYPKLPENPEF